MICCREELHIKIMTDFASYHLWCADCGVELDPEELGLPEFLILLIRNWGLSWDMVLSQDTSIRIDTYSKIYEETGNVIAFELGKYYKCHFKNFLESDLIIYRKVF